MKKLAAGFLVSTLLLSPFPANASVGTTVDKSGTTYISQVYQRGPWYSVKVQYPGENSSPTLTLVLPDPPYLGDTPPPYYLFSEQTQLITDDVISDLKLLDTYRDNNDLGIFEFTPTQIASIQNAKKVSLRVSFYNSNTIRWKVPEKVLQEWKEVFTKGKSQVPLR